MSVQSRACGKERKKQREGEKEGERKVSRVASDRLAKLRFLIGDEIGGADALGFKEERLLKHVGLVLDDVKLLQKRRDLNDGEEVVRYVLTAKDLLCLIKDQSSLLKVDHALEMILERILDHHDLLKMSTTFFFFFFWFKF